MYEGSVSKIPLTNNVYKCANCGMTFDTRLKLSDHMIVHNPEYGDETDDNNNSFSKDIENDTLPNRSRTRSHANHGKSVKKP